MAENKDKEIQENMLKMRYIEGQANAYQKQAGMLEQLLMELNTTLVSLNELQKIKGKKETLTAMGAGVFTETSTDKKETVLIDIGSGIVAERKITEAIAMIEERRKNHEEELKNYIDAIQQMRQEYFGASQKVEELRK